MNFFSSKLSLAIALLVSLGVGCSKKPVELPQRPGQNQPNQQQPSGITLSFETPDQAGIQADSATIWLEQPGRGQQQARVKLQPSSHKQSTGLIQLPDGDYLVNYLVLTNTKGKIVYASPRRQSEKATKVVRPLPQTVAAAPKAAAITLQVLPVAAADQALMFGYPYDVFRTQQMIRVNIQLGITIGKTLYNQFDAPLEITWYDARGDAYVQLMQLPAQQYGLHAIGLPADATRLEMRIRKWEQTFEKVILANQLHQDLMIEITGNMAVRQLKEEFTWHEVEGEYRAYSRKYYEYDAQGRVIKTMYYQKKPQSADLQLQSIEEISYLQGDRIGSIYYADGNNTRTGYLHFLYDVNWRLNRMEQRTLAGTTYAAVEYRNLDNKEEITIDYLYENGHAMEYKIWLQNGNKSSEGAISSTGGTESANFTYDQQINPYKVLGLQDIFLRHLSCNNMVNEERAYGRNIPSIEPYQFNYQYDAKGYPTQLIKKFKSHTSGAHLFNAKTQYNYLD